MQCFYRFLQCVISTRVIFSLQTTLFNKKGLTTLQHFLISHKSFPFRLPKNSLLLARKSVTHIFLCLIYLVLFSSVLFLRKRFLSLDLRIIAFDKVLFMKGDWFPLTYHFFWWACLFKVLLHKKLRFLELSLQLFPLVSIFSNSSLKSYYWSICNCDR